MSHSMFFAKVTSLPLCHGLIVGLVMLGFTGCGSSPSPESPALIADDHDQEVENFAEGVSTLRGHYETIRDALGEDDIDTAHDPIHQVGRLLESLKQLVDHVGLDADDKATAQAAIDKMFEAYGEVDKAIHGGQPVDYEAVREPLDQGMADLESVVQRAKSDH